MFYSSAAVSHKGLEIMELVSLKSSLKRRYNQNCMHLLVVGLVMVQIMFFVHAFDPFFKGEKKICQEQRPYNFLHRFGLIQVGFIMRTQTASLQGIRVFLKLWN